jgi:hypothetical protein
MHYRHAAVSLSAIAVTLLPSSACADETQVYEYDALGRLVTVQYSGTANPTLAHSLCYDPAGNRTVYKASAAGTLATCPPTPTPTQASNQSRVAAGARNVTVDSPDHSE